MEEELAGRTIISLASPDVLIVAVVHCFPKQETREEHHRKIYVDTFKVSLKQSVAQTVIQTRQFAKLQQPEKLLIPAEGGNGNYQKGIAAKKGKESYGGGALCENASKLHCCKA